MASSWGAALVQEGFNVLIVDYENHPEEWARKTSKLITPPAPEWARRWREHHAELAARLLASVDPDHLRGDVLVTLDNAQFEANRSGPGAFYHVSPMARTWTGARGPIWAQAPDIARIVDQLEIDVLIVDSIVPACGGADPMEPGTPVRYAEAIEIIGRPVLSLAHVTKQQSLDYPYASVFFHNLARLTFSLHQEEDSERRILTNRKANNYAKAGRFVVDLTWWNGNLVEVNEQGYIAALADRITAVLADDEMTVGQIVARLKAAEDGGDVKEDSVRHALNRGLTSKPQRFRLTAGKYSLS